MLKPNAEVEDNELSISRQTRSSSKASARQVQQRRAANRRVVIRKSQVKILSLRSSPIVNYSGGAGGKKVRRTMQTQITVPLFDRINADGDVKKYSDVSGMSNAVRRDRAQVTKVIGICLSSPAQGCFLVRDLGIYRGNL